MTKVFFTVVVIISLISCDDSYNLGNGYELMPTAVDCRAIGKNITLQGADYAVFGHVFDYAHDENFILALQVSQDSLLQYSNFNKLKWKDMDYLCKDSDGKRYYIIDKKKDSTYGPLDKKQYFVIRANLHIPNTLKLKDSR